MLCIRMPVNGRFIAGARGDLVHLMWGWVSNYHRYTTFEYHNEKVHNKWSYLNFLVYLRTKDHTDFTGPESTVHEMISLGEVSAP